MSRNQFNLSTIPSYKTKTLSVAYMMLKLYAHLRTKVTQIRRPRLRFGGSVPISAPSQRVHDAKRTPPQEACFKTEKESNAPPLNLPPFRWVHG